LRNQIVSMIRIKDIENTWFQQDSWIVAAPHCERDVLNYLNEIFAE